MRQVPIEAVLRECNCEGCMEERSDSLAVGGAKLLG